MISTTATTLWILIAVSNFAYLGEYKTEAACNSAVTSILKTRVHRTYEYLAKSAQNDKIISDELAKLVEGSKNSFACIPNGTETANTKAKH
jgi:hypothetical protein